MGSSPWLEYDDPNSELIVTEGDERLANQNDDYAGIPYSGRPEWMDKVMRSGQARLGDYTVRQPVFGDPVDATGACAMSHAFNGEQGFQYWNTSTTDGTDTSPGVCRTLIDIGLADAATQSIYTATALFYDDGGSPPVGPPLGTMIATCGGPSWAVWHKIVRDNMPPRGALDFIPQPEDYGYPPFSEGTSIEWEFSFPELRGIQIADGDPVETADYSNDWSLNGERGPHWGDEPSYTGPWMYGSVHEPVGIPDPDRPWVPWSYGTGPVEYQDIPYTNGWDGHNWTEAYTYVPDVSPETADSIAIAWPSVGAAAPGDNFSRFARPAFKYLLEARRFRFHHPDIVEEGPVTRQYPRDDGKGVSSAPRVHPPSKANRLASRYD